MNRHFLWVFVCCRHKQECKFVSRSPDINKNAGVVSRLAGLVTASIEG